MNDNMPNVIYARPVGATKDLGDNTSGPWNLEDTYGTSQRYVKDVKPSTDFTEILSNPNKRYLVYCREYRSWFIGYCRYGDDFLSVENESYGANSMINPSHWLPLPPDP